MSPEVLARLARVDIQVVAQNNGYFVLARNICVGIVREQDGRLSIGSSGIMTDSGLAYLIWAGCKPILAAHGGSQSPASPQQVEAVQGFSNDLKAAISQ